MFKQFILYLTEIGRKKFQQKYIYPKMKEVESRANGKVFRQMKQQQQPQ